MSDYSEASDIFPENLDILIVGGTAAGVAAALSAKNEGAQVGLICARPYLGEDICGDLRLWPDPGSTVKSELANRVFPDVSQPSTPMQVKLTLEQAMVEAGIPFLLNAFSAGVLTNEKGEIAGIQSATRSGLLPVPARLVVDATTEGVVGRLAGRKLHPLPAGRQTVRHTVLCLGEGRDADEVEVIDRPAGFSGKGPSGDWQLSARTYQLEVDFGGGSMRDLSRAEAEIVERCWTHGEYQHQERVVLATTRDFESLPDRDIIVDKTDGLVLLTPSVTDPQPLIDVLKNPIQAMDFAAMIGPWLCAQAAQRQKAGIDNLKQLDKIGDLDDFDVVVLGGGTAGAPAAIAASRKGADTLIIETLDQLGGVGTVGQIASYWCGNRVGFTSKIDEGTNELEASEEMRNRDSKWSVAAKSEWYHRNCYRAGTTLLFRSLCVGVEKDKNRVTALLVATPYGYGRIRAHCFIDATGCSDIPAAAGLPTRIITAEHIAVQGTGLAGLSPDHDYNNSDHGFCDDTDVRDTTAFLVSSKLKFRDRFDAGQLVDSRERRQIIGEISLGPSDFLSKRRYPDTICEAASNFDSHGFTIHPVFMCKPPDKKRLWADVPFRALLPKGLERVIVTGLGISAHRDALPVIRMQADVQNQGYAAGLAAAMSATRDIDLRDLPLCDIQKELVEMGNLPERVLTDTDNFPVAHERLRTAISEEWDSYEGLALIFANKERAQVLIREVLEKIEDPDKRLRMALILGLWGDAKGRQIIEKHLQDSPWDDGWNFTGMGQFGMSLSAVDAVLIASGRCGNAETWPVILDKMKALQGLPDFSHCRAVAEACEALYPRHPHEDVPECLAEMLQRSGMAGHARTTINDLQHDLDDDPCQTEPRNNVLRELHLARALYRCGDKEDMGAGILEAYGRDRRAHFARHAQAVLREPKG